MRDIQRYSPVGDGVAKTDINGMLVAYGEYRVLETHYDMAKAEVERLTERLGGVRLIVTEEMYDELNTKYLEQQHELQNIALTARQILDEKIDLKEQVERLTKAVMHSPAAQLKLKELEGKTTFEEINSDNQ